MNHIEKEYSLQVGHEHRAKYAQFFTPEHVANVMARWVTGAKIGGTILDPAFGLGVFERAVLAYDNSVRFRGYEIDPVICAVATETCSAEIVLKDYISADWSAKYQGIICNPYFKFHDYDNSLAVQEFEQNLGIRFSGFSNLYSLFLVKSLAQLSLGGRLAYIVPSEFLNSGYGELIKKFLLDSGMLRLVAVINFRDNVFDDALTTACIIMCANDHGSTTGFLEESGEKALDLISQFIEDYPSESPIIPHIPLTKLQHNVKWKAYYQTSNGKQFNHLVPFSTFARVKRGIATGANEYFCFSPNRAAELNIPKSELLPCVCKSSDIKGPFFTTEDYCSLEADGQKNVYLFNAGDPVSPQAIAYIKRGEEMGIDQKHLTSKRRPWHAVEKNTPAPIWVSVFNRSGVKFIRNVAGVANLTTFHGLHPVSDCPIDIDILFLYLLTDTAQQIFADNGREYGNGLSKFEPNDLNNAQCLDLSLLTEDEIGALQRLLFRYRNGDAGAIEEADSLLRKRYSNRVQSASQVA